MVSDRVNYSLDEQGRFTIENYNWAKPFSDFLPGIAGKRGIPMWVYYVSKNQGVCSFGIKDKDHAIMEFLSFNKACQIVGNYGFRTFFKIGNSGVYEAFKKTENPAITQRMIISSHELELQEINQELGVKVNVLYFNLVNLPIPGLVRRVTIENISTKNQNIEILDGAPRVLPYGVTFEHMKVISRHIEGMMGVSVVEGVPVYKLKQTAADIEEIGSIDGGNFYCAFSDKGRFLNENIIVDPKVIFGEIEDLGLPWIFTKNSIEAIMGMPQVRENRTPCAMSLVEKKLKNGEMVKIDSVIGYVDSLEMLPIFQKELREEDFLLRKQEENKEIIERLIQGTFTISGNPAFDQYCQQNYLDNGMRGGIPVNLESNGNRNIFYIFGRQGGDLERDYHWFVLEPTYLSQGNGHYRNVLQNRRMDNWFFPDIGDHNIQTFLNLTQLDGYNPLVVEVVRYIASDFKKIEGILEKVSNNDECLKSLMAFIQTPFTPGALLMQLEECVGEIGASHEDTLAELLLFCRTDEIGGLHEGYWIDHWFYNLDLIESFLAIFPDRIRELFFDTASYFFYDNPDVVQPRSKKTIMINEKVRQYRAVLRDPEKERLILSRTQNARKMHTKNGHGEVYFTNLLSKLLCLLTNKIASLDPFGIGVEMEAGKPGWCDSLNGLPGLFGSSICETLELIRLCRLLLSCFDNIHIPLTESHPLYGELHEFICQIKDSIQRYMASEDDDRTLAFWNETHTVKEEYREKTKFGITGDEESVSLDEIKNFIKDCLQFLEAKLSDSNKGKLKLKGVPYTYYTNQVAQYAVLPEKDPDRQAQVVEPKAFLQTPVALFLEGPTHYLRMYPEDAEDVYNSVKSSGMYDKKLKTFKVCSSLENESFELGRIKAYPSGWIEHESIYTHMQYKWLLEVLRAGLYEEFFREIKTAFPVFLDPHVYGRNFLENCSFIASSAHPDKTIHGQGFQPRFSGVTAEMLNIWLLMTVGKKPFSLNENRELQFHLKPTIPEWLFTHEETVSRYWNEITGWEEVVIPAKSFAFNLFGNTLVIYYNSKLKATFGQNRVQVRSNKFTYLNGEVCDVQNSSVGEPIARDLRDKHIRRIEVVLD